MENPLVVPRLRLTRHSPRMKADSNASPIAGPSRIPPDDYLNIPDDDEDTQSTPRLSTLAKLASEKSSPVNGISPGLPADTPAARLRALLARVPNNTPPAASRTYRPPSPSDLESDFEPVNASPSDTPSIARESLKELFSHALRDPGNTPLKGRRRRNSVDASPGIDSNVERERAYNRGKRASMSDEETEKSSSHHSRRDDASSRLSSAAATFDALRERLSRSTLSSKSPTPPDQPEASSSGSAQMDTSEDTTTMLKHFDGNISAPPNATSTPMRSMAIPLQMQSQSNLLEQDSEMQRAMRDLDSYDDDSQALQRRLGFPPMREQMGHTAPPSRPLSWSSHSKSHTANNLPLSRRTSEDFDSSSSRASSNISNAEYQERRAESEQDRMLDRERSWKLPSKVPTTPGTPERPRHQHSHSSPSNSHVVKPDTPAYSRSRRSSAASIQSFDDGRSSRNSSVSSKSEYRARMKEAEEEKNKERERLWNMPAQARARASSSLGMNSPSDRARTNSTPSRPDSAQGYLSPVHSHVHSHHSLSRKVSLSSLSSSSRASSPAHSPAHSVDGEKLVVQHIRERNWNSPHPKWRPSMPRRSVSPMPESETSPAAKRMNESYASMSHSLSRASVKSRRSLDMFPSPASSKPIPAHEKGKAREESLTPNPKPATLAKSPIPQSPPPNASHFRPKSPSPPPTPSEPVPPSSPSKIVNLKSRSRWQFPRDHALLPPLDTERDPPTSSIEPRPPSPVRQVPGSRIPTASSSQSVAQSGSGSSLENGISATHRKKGHRRSPTEFNEAVGRIPPRIEVLEEEVGLPPIPIVQRDEQETIASSSLSTPLAKPIDLPPAAPDTLPPRANVDLSSPQPKSGSISPSSPPPSSATNLPTFSSSLQTPPRKPSFHTSKIEFQTPSPPRNMPDLPGPPSSSENEDDDDRTPINRSAEMLDNLSNVKTPKPPGAWTATPLPSKSLSQRDLIVRPSSTPPSHAPSSLATTPAVRAVTMSRAGSLPMQTPAPPGAWLATPAAAASSVRRKSILKVRFDIDPGELSSDMSMLESTPPPGKTGVPPPPKPIPALNVIGNGSVTDGSVVGDGVIVDVDATPVRLVKKEPLKSPFVRLVDAFGRETMAAIAPPIRPSSPPPKQQNDLHAPVRRTPEPENSTPRSKSAIRIVDAMGREVKQEDHPEDEEIKPKMEARRPMRDLRLIRRNVKAVGVQDESDLELMSHNEALARVRATIADLAVDLDQVDRSYDDLTLDENRLSALEDASRAARNARKRISDSLRYVQTAEDDLKQKFGSLRKGMNESRFLPSVQTHSGVTWARINAWTVCVFLVIQLVLMVLMYRYSSVRTRKMFLTTYYDGFNVDLYLHLTRPELLRRSLPSPFSWSIFTVPDTVSRTGWSGAAGELWGNVTLLATDWRGRAWDAWSMSRESNSSWPPT